MPEFEEAQEFPSADDNLPSVPLQRWKNLFFAALDPAATFQDWIGPAEEQIGWLPFERAVFQPQDSRDYVVPANWALYCDNYLEGFHIPFVHPSLAKTVDYPSYETRAFRYSSLQIATGSEGEPAFEPPPGSPDHGRRVGGYYLWLFPTTMLNLYPWGISVNLVHPQAPDRTVVRYLTFVWDQRLRDRGAGAGLDGVEREDQSVVRAAQKGISGSLYRRGRYSPTREAGVHHFHRLLTEFLTMGEAEGRGATIPAPAPLRPSPR